MTWEISNPDKNYKQQNIGVIIGVLVGLLMVGGVLYFLFNQSSDSQEQEINWQTNYQLINKENNMPDNQNQLPVDHLIIEVLKPGSGAEVVTGDKLAVHYTGWLQSGQEFDSSVRRNQPFTFTIGAGQVIAGWDDGILGMKVGEKRKLTIPPQLAYGDQGAGGVIPSNSTLIFEVELISINK